MVEVFFILNLTDYGLLGLINLSYDIFYLTISLFKQNKNRTRAYSCFENFELAFKIWFTFTHFLVNNLKHLKNYKSKKKTEKFACIMTIFYLKKNDVFKTFTAIVVATM